MKTISVGRMWCLGVGLVAFATISCASTQALTQGEVGRSGARTFNEPKGTTFAICVGALTAEGYEIASSDARAGLIETQALAVRGSGPVTSRAYRVTVTPDGQGSRVVAQPIVYSGARDISNSDVWTLDGAQGERAQWSDLFSVMDAALVTQAPAARREAVPANGVAAPALAKEQAPPAAPDKNGPAAPSGGLTPAGLSTP